MHDDTADSNPQSQAVHCSVNHTSITQIISNFTGANRAGERAANGQREVRAVGSGTLVAERAV